MHPRYRAMIQGMRSAGDSDWWVYVLVCGDKTLYTGIAKDVDLRLQRHQTGKGARYTRTHLPVSLVYKEGGLTRSEALIREAQIKRMPRRRKEALIQGGS
jgi:predicted GIY-YIG superfamily endonuclease